MDATAIREVARSSQDGDRFALLAGRGKQGETCFSFEKIDAVSGEFSCLSELLRSGDAVVHFSMFGGSTPETLDRAVILGVARADVANVVITTRGGGIRELSRNSSRAFSYVAESISEVPTELRAFNAGGRLVDEAHFRPVPPSPAYAVD